MKISIITMVYNEESLLPYFLNHYSFADEIHIFVDSETTDKTRDILENNNVLMEEVCFPDGWNVVEKSRKLNEKIQQVECDWVIVPDADELVFSANGESVRHFLERQSGNVVYSNMWQVYRHITDKDLDPNLTPVPQRRHGSPVNRLEYFNGAYRKPIVLKKPVNAKLTEGSHNLVGNFTACREDLDGVHWAFADPSFSLKRAIDRKNRKISVTNRRHGFSNHWKSTDFHKRCVSHENDPELFFKEGTSMKSDNELKRGYEPKTISMPEGSIAGHMLILEEYAKKSNVLIEIGSAYGCGSTWAFRQGMEATCFNDKIWITVEILDQIKPLLRPALPFWHFVLGDSQSQKTIDNVKKIIGDRKPDVIFIDTVHTYQFLKEELENWKELADDSCTWLFHDTWMNGSYNKMTDAIKEFAEKEGKWTYFDLTRTCHGLGALVPISGGITVPVTLVPSLVAQTNGVVNLRLRDSESLSKFIEFLPNEIRMVEVGVYAGRAAEMFCRSGKVIEYYGVDPWVEGYDKAKEFARSNFTGAEGVFDKVVAGRYPFVRKMKRTSLDAVSCFDDNSLDLVYIDGDHRYDYVKKDILSWASKVKVGGIIAGHDYSRGYPDVVRAVDELFGKPDQIFEDTTWMTVCLAEHHERFSRLLSGIVSI